MRSTLVGPSGTTCTAIQPDPGLILHVLIHCSTGIWSSLVTLAGPRTASEPIYEDNIHGYYINWTTSGLI